MRVCARLEIPSVRARVRACAYARVCAFACARVRVGVVSKYYAWRKSSAAALSSARSVFRYRLLVLLLLLLPLLLPP